MSGGESDLLKSRSLRVEIYLPVRFDSSYQQTRDWLVGEFTAFFGGCSVVDHVQGGIGPTMVRPLKIGSPSSTLTRQNFALAKSEMYRLTWTD
jgi:hypothetical protein